MRTKSKEGLKDQQKDNASAPDSRQNIATGSPGPSRKENWTCIITRTLTGGKANKEDRKSTSNLSADVQAVASSSSPTLQRSAVSKPPLPAPVIIAQSLQSVADATTMPTVMGRVADGSDPVLSDDDSPIEDRQMDTDNVDYPTAAAQSTTVTPSNTKVADVGIKFQLIPISDIPGRNAVGEVVERTLTEGKHMRIGRQINKDGQISIKGNKKSTDVDCWFTSKVVSRLHCELWVKDGTVTTTKFSSISKISGALRGRF
jgi:hypothetical protein